MVVVPSEQKTGARSEESRYQQSRMIQRHDFIPICFEFSFFNSKNRLSPLLRWSMLSLHPLLTSCAFPGMMMSSPAPIAAPLWTGEGLLRSHALAQATAGTCVAPCCLLGAFHAHGPFYPHSALAAPMMSVAGACSCLCKQAVWPPLCSCSPLCWADTS